MSASPGQKEFLRQVIDISPSFIFVKDREGRFALVNRAVADAYGTTVEDLIGKTDADFNSNPDEVAAFRRDDLEVMDTLREKVIEEEAITDSTGKVRYLQTIKRPLIDADGTARHVLGVATDITQLKAAEEERRKLEAQVQHSQKLESLGVLAGGIAHDFNNLLVGVLGNVDLAQMMLADDAPARKPLQQVQVAAERAADLCRQLLDYSGKGRLVVKPLNLTETVEEITHLLKLSVSKRAVLNLDLARNLPLVEGDASQIRQVVMNLITNASDAIGERSGIISVITGATRISGESVEGMMEPDTLPPGTYAFVEVSDNGTGMDAATQARIFDPFFTTKFAGRGLGLAAVLGIVRGHHGGIRVMSRLGRGTSVRVLIPVTTAPAAADAPELTMPPPGGHGSGLVLVVDDEDTVRTVTRDILELHGYAVLTARNGDTAVEIFRQREAEIRVVLLDLTMPGMCGEETLRALRAVRADVAVILMSGFSETDTATRFPPHSLAAFLKKPFRAQELLEILERVCAGERAR